MIITRNSGSRIMQGGTSLANSYLSRLEALGINPTSGQRAALLEFERFGKSEGWLTGLLRFPITVWGSGAANQIDFARPTGICPHSGLSDHSDKSISPRGVNDFEGFIDLNINPATLPVANCGLGFYASTWNDDAFTDILSLGGGFELYNYGGIYEAKAGTGEKISVIDPSRTPGVYAANFRSTQRLVHFDGHIHVVGTQSIASSGPMPSTSPKAMADGATTRRYAAFMVWTGLSHGQADLLAQRIWELIQDLRAESPRFTFPAPNAILDLWPGGPGMGLVGGGAEAITFKTLATLSNRSTAAGKASEAEQATSASQPLFLAKGADGSYLYLPGVAGNMATVPASAPLNGLSEITIEWTGMLPDTDTLQVIAAKYDQTPGTIREWIFYLDAGFLRFAISNDGVNPSIISEAIPNVVSIKKGVHSFRVSKTGTSVTFYIDGNVIAAAQTLATGVVYAGNKALTFGGYDGGAPLRGTASRFRIWNNSTGTGAPILDLDFRKQRHRTNAFSCATGQTVTINSTGNNPAFIVGEAGILTDGVDDYLTGTLASGLSSGRMFAVVDTFGGDVGSRVFTSTEDETADDTDTTSFIWSKRDGTSLVSNDGGNLASLPNAFPGSGIHEVILANDEIAASWNSLPTSTESAQAVTVEAYAVASNPQAFDASTAMFLRRILILPADASPALVAQTRRYLKRTHHLPLLSLP